MAMRMLQLRVGCASSRAAHAPALVAAFAFALLAIAFAPRAQAAEAAAQAEAAEPAKAAEAPKAADAADSAKAANAAEGERLQVTAPFIELRTGPGRGFPVFYVADKGSWITVELRRTDWYRVRVPGHQGGQVGWVQRSQLESTLTEAGGSKTFRDLLVDDYLARKLELGGAWGRFKGEPMLKLWAQYRLGETLGVEATAGQVQGVFSGTSLWHLALVSEPWSDRRLSPFLAVGLGKLRNIPNTSLVGAIDTDAKLAFAAIGMRWYIAERFVARLDWSLYTAFVSDTRSQEYRAATLGVSFFF